MAEHQITSVDDLVALLGEPTEAVANKDRASLHDLDRQWLANSPFCLIATSGADGACDAPFFDLMVVKGHRPILAVVVAVEQVFQHCAKAFLRSQLWQPDSWQDHLPKRAVIAQTLERPDETLQNLELHYGPAYAAKLYG